MSDDLTFAFTLARALMAGKSAEELARLQIVLQTVNSLVLAEIGRLRLMGSKPDANS